MQENAPEWMPTYEPHMSWETRLFVLYLLIVCGFLAFRSAQMIWFLWRFDRHSGLLEAQSSRLRAVALASTKITSVYRLAIFTVLLSLWGLLDSFVTILARLLNRKTGGLRGALIRYIGIAHRFCSRYFRVYIALRNLRFL